MEKAKAIKALRTSRFLPEMFCRRFSDIAHLIIEMTDPNPHQKGVSGEQIVSRGIFKFQIMSPRIVCEEDDYNFPSHISRGCRSRSMAGRAFLRYQTRHRGALDSNSAKVISDFSASESGRR
jgi:hypothetical protein